jgi:hypothetical protein
MWSHNLAKENKSRAQVKFESSHVFAWERTRLARQKYKADGKRECEDKREHERKHNGEHKHDGEHEHDGKHKHGRKGHGDSDSANKAVDECP